MKWFKLGLEVDSGLTLPPGMTAQDVVRDYLSAIYKHVITTLYRRFDHRAMQLTKVDFVLTVPAIWSDAAKKKTLDAAATAGMANEHNLELLSEPESAAIYTLKTIESGHAQIGVGDRIIVVDAGGGTVDLISYDVKSVHPNLSVLETAPGVGDFCGSSFIDRGFEDLFSRRMGRHYNSLSFVNRQQVVRNFELTKIAFRNDVSQEHFYVNVPTIGDLEDAGVFGGNFEITRGEMKALFDPMIDQVLTLISNQAMTISTGPQAVNAILLVGGFGESEYLYQRIQTWAYQYNIQVIQPREASTAIVRGAVIRGLEPKTGPQKTEVVRKARRSYGVLINQPFIEGKHLQEDAWREPETGLLLAKNQVSWFIRRNQAMTDESTFRHTFVRNFRTLCPWKDCLVSSTKEVAPQRWEDGVVKHCTINSDLTGLSKKNFQKRWRKLQPYYTAKYDLVMNVKNSNLTMSLEFKETRYGIGDVEFE